MISTFGGVPRTHSAGIQARPIGKRQIIFYLAHLEKHAILTYFQSIVYLLYIME